MQDELTTNMIPFNTLRLGNLPYLFCYASDALRLCFYVIEKSNEKKATPVTDMLNLGTVEGRLSVLLAVVNIYRIIGSFKNNARTICLNLLPPALLTLPPPAVFLIAGLHRAGGGAPAWLPDEVVASLCRNPAGGAHC